MGDVVSTKTCPPVRLHPLSSDLVRTGVVPAAAGSASSPPAALKRDGAPEVGGVLTQSVGGQVADLQPGELEQKLLERHPDTQTHVSRPSTNQTSSCSGPEPTYQNSPSSILFSSSSFSSESTWFHSTELKHRQSLTTHRPAAAAQSGYRPVAPGAAPLHLTPWVPDSNQALLPAAELHLHHTCRSS